MAQLDRMQAILQESDYGAQLREMPGQTAAYLEVNYGADEMGRDRLLQISHISSPVDDSTTTQFIKFWMPLPFQAPSDRLAEVAHAVTIINEELVLGHLGLALPGDLHYQYCLALEQNATLGEKMLVELVALMEFQRDHFGDYLEGVCDGEISVSVLNQVIQHSSPPRLG